MEKIFVFELKFIGKGEPNWPVDTWYENAIDVLSDNYDDALSQARKEFIRRQNGYLDNIEYEDIEVLYWEFG